MRIDIPILLTPMNITGLAHASTILQMSRKMDFTDTDAYLFNSTNTGAEKNNFIINYELSTAQVAYVRYKIVFQNGTTSHWSPIAMVSNNNSRKQEYTLDAFSAIPATPKITIKDFNYSNVPHTSIHVESNDLAFYVGSGTHVASSWYLMDKNDNVIWKSENNEFSLNNIIIDKKEFPNDGIYKIGLAKIVSASGVTFKTLTGIKIFNATDDDSLDFRDKSLDVDFDNFILYSRSQSELTFSHGISGFKYLSIKFYDRNGILTGEEIKAETSPAYINTNLIEAGGTYRMQVIGFYLDGENNIKSTMMRDKNYIAQKHSLANVIPETDYRKMTELGFHEVKGYQDEDCIYFNYADSFLDGSSAIYIKEGMIFLGYWLEGGYVLNNKFINISPLNISKTSKVQITQKINGNYIIIGQTDTATNYVKVVEFRLLSSNDNTRNIEIVSQNYLLDADLVLSIKSGYTNRVLFGSTNNKNIFLTNLFKGATSWGANASLLVIKELYNDVVYTRATLLGNGVSRVCSTSLIDTLACVEFKKISATYYLNLSYLNISNSENIIRTTALELNTVTNSTHPVIVDLLTNLFNTNSHTDGLNISLVALDIDNLLMTVRDMKTDGNFYEHYRYNITQAEWYLVRDTTGAGREHVNLVTAGYNVYRTIKGKPPLRLK